MLVSRWNSWWSSLIVSMLSTLMEWVTAKALLRGKFIAKQSYLKKQEKLQIDNLNLYLKQLEKEEQTKERNPKLVEGNKS